MASKLPSAHDGFWLLFMVNVNDGLIMIMMLEFIADDGSMAHDGQVSMLTTVYAGS